jgi:hypothetical protein
MKNIYISLYIIWTIAVIAQQIYWVSIGYNLGSFIWAIIAIVLVPYIIYKALK